MSSWTRGERVGRGGLLMNSLQSFLNRRLRNRDGSVWPIMLFALLCMHGIANGQSQSSGKIEASSNKQLASPAIERKVDALLKRMPGEEKLGQLVQYSDSGYSGQALTAEEVANPGKSPA